MNETWTGDEPPAPELTITLMGWLRVVLRGVPLAVVTFGCLAILLLVRLIERPLCGARRPVTPYITQFVCKSAFRILGMGHKVTGQVMAHPGALVANHSSWLDIFALNAPARIYFVSKAEVASWPGIGWLARATGAVFIERKREKAAEQKQVFERRLLDGHKLLFFPEGTSTDGRRVLPFKPTLLAAFFEPALRDTLYVQPISVSYFAPEGEDARFYGWWGDMDFGPHLLRTLAAPKQGRVEITYHAPQKVSDAVNRKTLAAALEAQVRSTLIAQGIANSPDAPA